MKPRIASFFHSLQRMVLLCVAVMALAENRGAASSTPRNLSIGIAAHNGAADFDLRALQLGGLNHATVYATLGDAPIEYRKFDRRLHILLVLGLPRKSESGSLSKMMAWLLNHGQSLPQQDDVGELRKIVAGAYDGQLRALAARINTDGRKITLRVLPEFNGKWTPWGVYYRGNHPADFTPAWRHIVGLLRAETDLIRFDLNFNRYSAKKGGGTGDFALLYPGDEWVDQVSISSYNRCGLVADNTKPRSFADDFRLAYDTIVGLVGPQMPLAVAETSTTSLCGTQKQLWFEALFTELETNFTRVTNVTFFLVPVKKGSATNDIPIHWELENSAEVQMFHKLLTDFRQRMLIPPPLFP